MPFDAISATRTVQGQTATALADIVTEPLPRAMIEAHKEAVLAAFRAKGPAKARLLDSGMARWVSRSIDVRRLRLWVAPRPLKRLAYRIAEDVPEATFIIHYFYADPILEVRLSPHREGQYLGIWDRGKLIAMATVNHEPASVAARRAMRRGWRRCRMIAAAIAT